MLEPIRRNGSNFPILNELGEDQAKCTPCSHIPRARQMSLGKTRSRRLPLLLPPHITPRFGNFGNGRICDGDRSHRRIYSSYLCPDATGSRCLCDGRRPS
jgi:hypothetical protein